MSQITTCPSCSTRFRVVADQLRISDGWVRCGQCQEVFDARNHLHMAVEVQPEAAQADLSALISNPAAVSAAVVRARAASASAAPSTSVVAAEAEAQSAGVVPQPPGPETPAPVATAHNPALAPGYALPVPQWPDELDVASHQPVPAEPVMAESLRSSDEAQELSVLQSIALEQSAVVAEKRCTAFSSAILSEKGLQGPADEREKLSKEELLSTQNGALAAPVGPAMPEEWVERPATSTQDVSTVRNAQSVGVEDTGLATAPVDEIESAAQKLVQAEPWPAVTAASAVAPAFPVAEPTDDDLLVLDSSLEPGFVRDARRKAWWQKPVVRVAMGAGVVVLPVALALQVALHERNALAAWQPSLRPALEFMCTALQCKLGPRQQIAAMVVSGSAFAKGEQERAYHLSLSIQNRAGTPMGMPAVELTLTDAQDQAIARKVILAKELGAPMELKAGAEWSGSVPVATDGLNLQVSGYRVLMFYP